MLCRLILTAIAISCTFSRETPAHARGLGSPSLNQIKDVICVLLLSGLQKEDLDAHTMEKLRRHNVNIYDMNNESLRQECILKSLNAGNESQNYNTNDEKNDTSLLIINKQTQSKGLNIADIKKSETDAPAAYLVDKSKPRNFIDYVTVKDDKHEEHIRNDNIEISNSNINNLGKANITQVEELKDVQYEYLRNQPSLDGVMKFWNKLKLKYRPETGVKNTTTCPPPIKEEILTTVYLDNKGYVHSREIEYVNRIIEEYIASQTEPTTTQGYKEKSSIINSITKQINELLAKKSKIEELDSVSLKNLDGNLPYIINTKANGLTDLNKLIQTNNENNEKKEKVIPRELSNYYNLKNVDETIAYPTNMQQINDLNDLNKLIQINNKMNEAKSTQTILHELNNYVNLKNIDESVAYPTNMKAINDLTDLNELIQINNKDIEINRTQSIPHTLNNYDNLKNIDESIPYPLTMETRNDLNKLVQINNKDNEVKTTQVVPQKINHYDYNDQMARLQDMSHSPVINISPRKINKKPTYEQQNVQRQHLDNMPLLNEYLMITPISYHESNLQNGVKQEQDTREKVFKRYPYNASSINNTNKKSEQVQTNRNLNDPAVVSADIIQSIAEKVKEIVMKDIIKEIPTPKVTTPTSATKNTIVTIQPVAPYKEKETQRADVLQKIMDLFKQFKTMKGATDAPPQLSLNYGKPSYRVQPLDSMFPPIMTGINKSWKKIPLSHVQRELQRSPQSKLYQKNEYRMPPLTIQTNSIEIAPLAIQVSKPITLINQHMIVTTQNPFARHKELQSESKQRFNDNYSDMLSVGQKPTYADLTKKLRIAENIKSDFRDTYKDRIQKLKEKIKHTQDQNREQAKQLSHLLGSGHYVGVNRIMKPTFQNPGPIVGSGHFDTLNRPRDLNYNDNSKRPTYSNDEEALNRLLDSNPHKTFNQKLDSSRQVNRPFVSNSRETFIRPPQNLNLPINFNHHETFSKPLESNQQSLNQPMDINEYEALNRPQDSNQRDIITREVLSRLVGSNHHDIISRLIEPSARDVINSPANLNQQSRSHHSDAYERIEHERTHPHYKGARFHEELERMEHLNGGNYGKGYPSTTCCDAIAARQQMPLSSLKHRIRHDDTHFKNFLKSQQQVTDILERILAAKTKNRPRSVETS